MIIPFYEVDETSDNHIWHDKVDKTPNNHIWHHGIVGKTRFKANFTREQLVEIIFPLLKNTVLFKNVFCSFVFHCEIASVKDIDIMLTCITHGNEYPVYNFEEAFNQIFDDKDIVNLLNRIKLVYECCDSTAVKWFLNQVFTDKVVDFINSNFRYYPLIWVDYLQEEDIIDYIVDEKDGNDDKIVDCLPIIGDQRAFLLGEVDLSLFKPLQQSNLFPEIFFSPYLRICDYIPMYFPQESYCTFLLENGDIILTKKFGYENNIVIGGSLSYYHTEICDKDIKINKEDVNIYSLNCLNYIVDDQYRFIVEHDTYDSSLC